MGKRLILAGLFATFTLTVTLIDNYAILGHGKFIDIPAPHLTLNTNMECSKDPGVFC